MIAVAALVVGLVWFGVSSQAADVRGRVCQAVADVFRADVSCGEGGETPDDETQGPEDEDFEPDKCRTHETGDEYSAVVKIGFLEFGQNSGFVVTEYSDGSVTMTATDGGEIGATGGFGADAAWGQLEAGAKIDFGAGLEFDYGSTWHFDTPEEATEFGDQLKEYLAQQKAQQYCYQNGGIYCPILDEVGPPPVPTTTFGGVAVTGDITGDLGVSATSGTSPMPQGQMTLQGVVAQLGGESKWTVTNDNGNTPDDPADDTRTYVTDMSLNAELTGQIGLATGGGGSLVGVSLSVKKDADGNIIEVQIVSTSEVTKSGGGDATGSGSNGGGDDKDTGSVGVNSGTTDGDVVVTETTLAIDPDDTAAQQTVAEWMGGEGDFAWPGLISLNMIDPSKADPDDPFAMLLFNDATSSTVAYDHVTDVQGFALNVKFGLAFGADFTMESSETTATEAAYLGAPRPDGTRPVVPYEACVE